MASETTEILCTKDYTLFKWHKEQRALKPLKVNRMMASMKKRGFLPSKPIEINEKFEIMDGQYRFQSAKNLGLCVYYVKTEGITIDDVREMAKESNKWDTEDYITSFIRQGKESYIELMEWQKRLNLTWSKLFRTGILYSPGSRLTEQRIALQGGSLTLSAEGRRRVAAFEKHYKEIRPINRTVTEQIDFIGALAYLTSHDKYDPKQMMKRLDYQSRSLVKCPDTASYVDLLSSIYNYNSQKQNIVNFSYPNNNFLRRKGR